MKTGPAVALIALLGAGCDNPTATFACPGILVPAIVVEVRDSRTGLAIAQNAKGVVQEGVYVDSLRAYFGALPDPATLLSLQAAWGRAGTYSVNVQRPNYLPWTASGIKVTSGLCGITSVTLHADLVAIVP